VFRFACCPPRSRKPHYALHLVRRQFVRSVCPVSVPKVLAPKTGRKVARVTSYWWGDLKSKIKGQGHEAPPSCAIKNGRVFAALHAMHNAAYAVIRCLSVRLSRSCIVSKRVLYSQTFSLSRRATIMFFPCQTLWQYLDVDSHNGGVECRCMGMKKLRFSTNVSLYLGNDTR